MHDGTSGVCQGTLAPMVLETLEMLARFLAPEEGL